MKMLNLSYTQVTRWKVYYKLDVNWMQEKKAKKFFHRNDKNKSTKNKRFSFRLFSPFFSSVIWNFIFVWFLSNDDEHFSWTVKTFSAEHYLSKYKFLNFGRRFSRNYQNAKSKQMSKIYIICYACKYILMYNFNAKAIQLRRIVMHMISSVEGEKSWKN